MTTILFPSGRHRRPWWTGNRFHVLVLATAVAGLLAGALA